MADEENNTNPRGVQAAPPPPTHNPDSEDRCVICLEDLSDPCELVPCGHYNFDVGCIGAWLAVKRRCPLCKAFADQIIRGPHGLPGRPVIELRNDTEILAASLWPRSSASSSSRRPRYTHADFAAAGAAYARSVNPARAPTTTPTAPVVDDLEHRRDVYARGLYSLHVGSNPISRYREITPSLFRRDPELQMRARVFLRRELRVFDFVPTARTAFLVEYVVAMLKIRDAVGGSLQALLAGDLGSSAARLLLHELRAWLRSPYPSLRDWDQAVRYPRLDAWVARVERLHRLREREVLELRQQQRQRQGGEYKFGIWLPDGDDTPRSITYGESSASMLYAHVGAYYTHTSQPYRQQQ